MVNFALLKSSRNFSHSSLVLHRCYHAGKAGSVHTAIQQGLRKSRGQGFRGSNKGLAADDPREKYRVEHGISKYETLSKADYSRDGYGRGFEKKSIVNRAGKSLNAWEKRGRADTRGFEKSSSGQITRDSPHAWEKRGKTDTSELRIRLGKRLIAGKETESGSNFERPARSTQAYEETSSRHAGRHLRDSNDNSQPWSTRKEDGRSTKSGRSDAEGSRYAGKREQRFGGTSSHVRDSRQPFERARDSQDHTPDWAGREGDSVYSSARSGRSSDDRPYGSRSYARSSESSGGDRYPSLSFKRKSSDSTFNNVSSTDRSSERSRSQREPASFDRNIKYDSNASSTNAQRDEPSSTRGLKFTQVADNRIPLSIPYTTPASEFLYGTSVVEAALSSRKEPRRKLYKFYVYNGENREDPDQDARLERLARRNGVEVVRAGNNWLRVMDKMSGGRPHNGYILEASPLPRLPVTSLGQLTTVDGQDGFEVSIDYQSREEAAINGTSNFIKFPTTRQGRKPLVLLLDSIVDPGNLGGIIRTGAFLGVTAIAISSRNSASFTPVVLKASAGASEDVTLFMVNKPAGFVVDSKNAGWKIFAGVAPAKKHDPAMPASMSTDQLDDPLSEDPCILMLGSEGEGLRWNLRSKADVDLYIEGSHQSHNVDSLNVSVAAGILCSSFLKRSKPKRLAPIQQEQDEDKGVSETAKLF
ncbi:hypothetical protein N431DRAFT_435108 [Stipitochalara longipes BDJ]|nr:hypothetical protein N431DRAFT_435108 [Stipitochalara longipes BDJ]